MTYPLTYVFLVAFVVMVVLATVVGIASPRQPVKWHRVALLGDLALWNLADFLSNLATTAEQVELLARVFGPVWIAAPVIVLWTAMAYARRPSRGRRLAQLAMFVPGAVCLGVLEAGLLHERYIPASDNHGFFVSVATDWQWLVVAYSLSYVLGAGWLMRSVGHRDRHEILRSTGTGFLILAVPAAILGLLFNGILTRMGVYPPYLASVVLSAIAAVIAAKGFRREFFEPLAHEQAAHELVAEELLRREQILANLPVAIAIVDRDTSEPIYVNPRLASLFGTHLAGLHTVLEQLLQTGNEPITYLPNGQPVLSGLAELEHADRPVRLVVLQDATDLLQLQDELSYTRSQLAQAQRMEAMGTLATGVIHDFNNQLTVVLASTSNLQNTLNDIAAVSEDLSEIVRAVERSQNLITQVLNFAGNNELATVVMDVSHVLGKLKPTLQRTIGPAIHLTLRRTHRPIWIMMPQSQFEQVMMALANNACAAMPDGGRLTIELAETDSTLSGILAEIHVRDTGFGMSKEVTKRMMEPFFTTKRGSGTGLGLTMAHHYLQSAGATIEVDSAPGRGTEFVIRFRTVPAPRKADADRNHGTHEDWGCSASQIRILLVDDEATIRSALSKILRREGYEVNEADGATQALDCATSVRYDILVTDVVMPEISGVELAEKLKANQPELAIVFISGQDLGNVQVDERTTCLRKPFHPRDLLRAVREVSSRGSG